MKGAVMIIGSLWWDKHPERVSWRNNHLDLSNRCGVKAAIYYGRRSKKRGETFTMVIGGDSLGKAIIVPFKNEINKFGDLLLEARAIWHAEGGKNSTGIGAQWGCIGALFANSVTPANVPQDWKNEFANQGQEGIAPVDRFGQLQIGWPLGEDKLPVEFDVILATATRPETSRPSPEIIAEAWLDDGLAGNHNVKYFFQSVANGIRTEDDLLIWKGLEGVIPAWDECPDYQEAIKILRAESEISTVQ